MSRAEVDLQTSVKKACNSDEVPPKRKHVRACIVYTWDHKNSRAFWNAVKIQPLQSSEIQLFKALIMIHKVLQEGHPNTLKDAFRNRDFIGSLATVFPSHGSAYGKLIYQYDKYLLQKLDFHRNNPGFNGTFEYEEYLSLRAVNDPNEGYESILQLMDLQDSINDLQQLIFATIHQSRNNLCKVSALVPLISESYGIYKFCISMLRALYQQLGEDEALKVLFDRFESQHFMLRDFYTDCHSIKFLTSLITIPRLPNSSPDLMVQEDGQPAPRARSVSDLGDNHQLSQISSRATPSLAEEPFTAPPESVDNLYTERNDNLYQQQQEQEQLQQQLELQRQQQLQQQEQQQRLFEQQQREQERRFMEEQRALQMQQTQQNQGRVAELERDLLMFKSQYDNDQSLLQQYDSRVKSLENELAAFNDTAAQQVNSKSEQIKNLEDQIANWTKKYESLAKLYSQLRQEHLNLLAKFKKIQQKISSAQESILKKEKLEKDLKAKNIELADLIRERDRARLELDRVRAGKDQEIEKLETQIRELNVSASESGKLQNMNLSSLMAKHERELSDLQSQLKERNNKLEQLGDLNGLEAKLRDKDIELEIANQSLEAAYQELTRFKEDQDDIVNAEIDHIIMEHLSKFKGLIDLFLDNNIKRVLDTKRQLTLPGHTGTYGSSPEHLLSIIEQCSDVATDLASTFNEYIAENNNQDEEVFSKIILNTSSLATFLNELALNAKAFAKGSPSADEESILSQMSNILDDAENYYSGLKTNELDKFKSDDDKIDAVIDLNLELQTSMKLLGGLFDELRSSSAIDFKGGNLEDLLDRELSQTVKTVDHASQFLTNLMKDVTIYGGDVKVHEALLACAKAITDAVARLIKASVSSQKEIVDRGMGKQSRTEFYKKNNRWTEGLISAAKAVAGATNILIHTSDGVLRQKNSHEELIVASNEVAASTAQLVAASRVKADFVSKSQNTLEDASTSVTSACKALVEQVRSLLKKEEEVETIDLSKLTPYEGKTIEMEQQVLILKLENKLLSARKRLGEIRRHGYRDDNSDDE
ncbi:sla2 Src-like adaptor 2 [Lodderomyces elongisporus]|uniref:sla2 Src-like adaptor 2 n=1 Tax=Lodderomyces elongisporus TaxID=36914 RepID=UPI00291ECF1A|nr:sla2 Src-like adaptor 2 [Lodderomyces elongisporus]WLF81350.1 sla2 Src-like adaptor 2 [Lodderomyces elongisporus]